VSVTEAKKRLAKLAGSRFEPKSLSIYLNMLSGLSNSNTANKLEFPIDLLQLSEGLMLTQDVVNSSSSILLTKGTVIEQSHIDKLLEISKEHEEQFSIFIKNQA